jgi:hypothetical protein
MKQIILPASGLFKLLDNGAGTFIYSAVTKGEITMLDRLSAQSNLLKCTDLDWLNKHTPEVIKKLCQ